MLPSGPALVKIILVLVVIGGLITAGVMLYLHYSKPGIAAKYLDDKDSNHYIVLKKDGAYNETIYTAELRGKYSVSGSSITLTPTTIAIPTRSGTIKDGVITLTDGERFVKEK